MPQFSVNLSSHLLRSLVLFLSDNPPWKNLAR